MTDNNRKSERRDYQITINIERSLFNMINDVLTQENISASDYGRGLIVWDLVEKNLLSREDLVRICIMGKITKNGAAKLQEPLPLV